MREPREGWDTFVQRVSSHDVQNSTRLVVETQGGVGKAASNHPYLLVILARRGTFHLSRIMIIVTGRRFCRHLAAALAADADLLLEMVGCQL